ncbi:DegQ family serine endoprotease [Tistrella mobilis]|uniref:Serine protease n=1 Tax=Tistrella mobilis TaxID=171437 RepID=A0A162K790_9PROT|nr:DegQ family serine endoprotease [Tistrella mobilis]KYO50615.1 serine protease [Tistrella mobilis]
MNRLPERGADLTAVIRGGLRSSMLALVLALAALQVPPAVAAETERRVPESRREMQLSFAPVVRQAAPAVVNIYTRRTVVVQQRSPFFDDPFFRRFFGDRMGIGKPSERVQNALGSGVIVDGRGYIVTNNHVIDGADQITVVLNDRREFAAEVVRLDPQTDLAVLKIDTEGQTLPALSFGDSDSIEVGDLVLAIGNPFGVGQTVTSGIVSALARTMVGVSDFQSFIQTDAAINPGNSGGALVTVNGELIGVNTAIFSRSGGSNGIGFAIPATLVKTVVEAAIEGRPVARAWLGARGQPVTQEIAESLGMTRPTGVLVSDVHPDGPAKGVLKRGDVILEIGGKPVDDPRALRFRLAAAGIGGETAVTIWREGRRQTASLPLIAAPETVARDEREITGSNPLAGARIANLSPALAEELGIDGFEEGVIVVDITRNSAAASIGLKPGDMVLAVNGKRLSRTADVEKTLKQMQGQRRWQLTLRREGRELTLDLMG